MAFLASVLSVIASTLSFWIERDTADTKVIHYYVSTQCSVRHGKHSFDLNNLDDLEDMQERNISTNVSTSKTGETVKHHALRQTDDDDDDLGRTATTLQSPSNASKNVITPVEKQRLIDNRGKTLALGESIAEVFRIPPKNIEVGHTMMTKYGVITHIVHYIYDDDLEMMQEELNEHGLSHVVVTAQYFAQQLFTVFRSDISSVFRKHFGLNKDFEVSYHHRLAVGKKVMRKQKSAEHEAGSVEGTRDVVLQRMVTQISLECVSDPRRKVIQGLRELFELEGAQTDKDRLDLYLSLMEGVDGCLAEEEQEQDHGVGVYHLDVGALGQSKKQIAFSSLASRLLAQKSKSVSVLNESDEELGEVEMEEMETLRKSQ